MENKDALNGEAGDYVDVKQLLLTYLRYWYLFVIGLAICIGLAYFYLITTSPQYRVSSTILLKNEENQTGLRNQEPGELNLFSTKQNIDNELEVLNSKSLMHRVFSELSLNVTYHVKEEFRNREIYGKELPFKLSITKLHNTADGRSITIQRRTSSTFTIQEKEGKPDRKSTRLNSSHGDTFPTRRSSDLELNASGIFRTFTECNLSCKGGI